MGFLPIALATAANVMALLKAEYDHSRSGIWRAKPLASIGFILAALAMGAIETSFGVAILIGLILGALGDVLLIPSGQKYFLGGIGSFLLGHIAFVVAFAMRGADPVHLAMAIAVTVPSGVGAFLWLQPHVHGPMKGAVIAYITVICLMVMTAAGAYHTRGEILLGALLFFLSDLSVARDRFIKREFVNKAWGLPAYYTAQLIMAWCAQP